MLITTDGNLRYEGPYHGDWELAFSDISIVAEYTTDRGPFLEDYFIAFVTSAGDVYDAPHSAITGEVREALRRRLGVVVESFLVCSTIWASRILWPGELAGKELYAFLPCKPAWLWRCTRWLIGLWRFRLALSSQVILYLKKAEQDCSRTS